MHRESIQLPFTDGIFTEIILWLTGFISCFGVNGNSQVMKLRELCPLKLKISVHSYTLCFSQGGNWSVCASVKARFNLTGIFYCSCKADTSFQLL